MGITLLFSTQYIRKTCFNIDLAHQEKGGTLKIMNLHIQMEALSASELHRWAESRHWAKGHLLVVPLFIVPVNQ